MRPIRVYLQQPALPSYRVGVFRALARRPGISLELVYDKTEGLTNVSPDGFIGAEVPSSKLTVHNRSIHWHSAMLDGASRARADVLILSWNLNYASLLPALLKAKRNNVATILWGHGYTKTDAWYRRWPREQVTRLADALLFYNRTHADAFIEAGTPSDKVFVAQNALDESPIVAARESWLARPDDLAAFRRAESIDGREIVLFVSRLTDKARVDLLIDAVPALLSYRPTALVVFIGGGDLPKWKARVEALGVSEHVHFVGPIYDEAKLAPWFLSSRVFCYPSGVGLSIIHAFNYGLPIVTDDNYTLHNPEIEALGPDENGMLYRYEDAGDLALKLAEVIGNDSLRDRLSADALATVRTRFNLKTMVDGFEAAVRYANSHRREIAI